MALPRAVPKRTFWFYAKIFSSALSAPSLSTMTCGIVHLCSAVSSSKMVFSCPIIALITTLGPEITSAESLAGVKYPPR